MSRAERFGLASIRTVFSHRNYSIYVSGNAISLVGSWVQRVALGWLTWQLTGSAAWVGFVALLDLCPAAILGPFGGAYSDRVGRFRIIVISQTLSMIQAFALAAVVLSGQATPPIVAALALFNGVVIGFAQPSRLAIAARLVPHKDLPTALAINSIAFNIARFLGPAAAGALLVGFSAGVAFLVNGLSFAVFLIGLTQIRLPPEPRREGRTNFTALLADVREGMGMAVASPRIRIPLLVMVSSTVLVQSFADLLPGIADLFFGGGAGTFATLTTSVGFGALLGAVWLAGWGRAFDPVSAAIVAALAGALSLIALIAAPDVWLAALAAGIAGLTGVIAAIQSQTAMQLAVPEEFRARIMSFYGLIFRGGPSVGAFGIGVLSEVVGLALPLTLSALLSLLIGIVLWQKRPRHDAAIVQVDGASRQAPPTERLS